MVRKYKLAEAIQIAARDGNPVLSINQDVIQDNPVVTIHQDFTRSGKSFATFKRACGKYRGNTCGSAY